MKISVALCTYNGEQFLEQQIESILNQFLPIDEIIICDDKSSDGTVTVIKKIIERFPQKIVLYENISNLGVIQCFEKCIELCTGDIIFLSDQDDVWLPEKVRTLRDVFIKDPKALLVFSDGLLINESNEEIEGSLWEMWGFSSEVQNEWKNNKKSFLSLISGDNKITGATVAFRKELKAHIFPFVLPNLYYHDAWLGLIASALNGLRFIDIGLIKYRVHKNQQVGLGAGQALLNPSNNKGDVENISLYEFQKKIFNLYPNFNLKNHIHWSSKIKNIFQKF